MRNLGKKLIPQQDRLLESRRSETIVHCLDVGKTRTLNTSKKVYSATDKEGDLRFKGFLDAPGKTKTIT